MLVAYIYGAIIGKALWDHTLVIIIIKGTDKLFLVIPVHSHPRLAHIKISS